MALTIYFLTLAGFSAAWPEGAPIPMMIFMLLALPFAIGSTSKEFF